MSCEPQPGELFAERWSSIRVCIEPTPIERPLFPQLAARRRRFTAWSELPYTAYSVVMPGFAP